jgi:hypothetical protein
MSTHFHLPAALVLLASGVLLPALSAQQAPKAAAPAAAQAPAATAAPAKSAPADTKTSIFGEPLYVNGKRVSDQDIKVYLMYGPARLMLEMYKIGVIVDDQLQRTAVEATETEITRRATEKPFASPEERQQAYDAELRQQKAKVQEKYAVTDAEYQEEYDQTIKDFKEKFPVLDVPAEIARAFRTVDWYRIQLRQTLQFHRVFLPDDPAEWPVVTLEAVRADSGDVLVDDAVTSYSTRKGVQEKNGLKKLPKEDTIYVQMMTQIVRDAMFGLVDFKTQPEAPAGIALWADTNSDGKPELQLSIDELWDKVKDTISEAEINEAKQWFVTSIATRDRETKEGILLSSEDCKAALDEYVKRFLNSYASLEVMATKTLFFPSLETYKDYHCLLEGFQRSVEPKLAPGPGGELAQPLRNYFDRANRIMGLGQVDSEVMLISALDIPHFRWKNDGWNWAEKKANELKAKIDANTLAYNEQKANELKAKQDGTVYEPKEPAVEPYRFWTQMMDDNSEYWDPPAPEKGKGSDVAYKRKGRFGPRYRNDLIGFVGESTYTNWITGTSITDHLFFDQGEGTIAGPFRGPQGYYLTRVNKRTGPTRPLNLAEPKHLQLLKDDYLRVAFTDYAKEAVAQADVKGFAKK